MKNTIVPKKQRVINHLNTYTEHTFTVLELAKRLHVGPKDVHNAIQSLKPQITIETKLDGFNNYTFTKTKTVNKIVANISSMKKVKKPRKAPRSSLVIEIDKEIAALNNKIKELESFRKKVL